MVNSNNLIIWMLRFDQNILDPISINCHSSFTLEENIKEQELRLKVTTFTCD